MLLKQTQVYIPNLFLHTGGAMGMFSELIDFEPEIEPVEHEPGPPSAQTAWHPEDFTPLEAAKPSKLLEAQVNTTAWLDEMGVPSDEMIDAKLQTEAARDAFTAVVTATAPGKEPELSERAKLVALKTPEAVRHLTGMLVAYDWEFVQQAKELRGYAVAKIVEETKNADARIRLRALQMLGQVTEVGLFTERVEVTRIDASEAEIEKRLREKLSKFMGAANIVDAQMIEHEPAQPAPFVSIKPETEDLDDEIGRIAEVSPRAG